MSESDIIGSGQSAFGEAERRVGQAVGSPDLQVDGAANQVKGGARKATAKVQKVIDKTADRLAGSLSAANDKTRAALDKASDSFQKVTDKVDPFVTERPYTALGIGLGIGVVIGMLLAARAPKVIYIKPRL